MRGRFFVNIIIKAMYVLSSVAAFCATDFLLFGIDYGNWVKLANDKRHAHTYHHQEVPKPGNVLLPPMGFCDIHGASSDNRNRYINTHRYLCEISPHVLYQYMMLVLWFMLVMGIAISSIGFISHIVSCFCKCLTL